MRSAFQPGDSSDSRHEARISPNSRGFLYTLIGLAIVRLWIMPLGSSFWIDETGTLWAVRDAFAEMLRRSAEWHVVSYFYGVIAWAAYAVGGAHEFALRLPSLAAALVAAALHHCLAQRLLSADAALASLAFFVCSYPVVFAAGDARPYALVLAVVIAATLSLVRWLDSGSGLYAALYALTAGMVPNAHLFATPVLAVHAAYALMRVREGARVPARHARLVGLTIILLMLPLVPSCLVLARKSRALVVARTPTIHEVLIQMAPMPVMLAIIGGIIAALFACGDLHLARIRVPASTCALLWGLFLFPNVAFLCLACWTPVKIFVARYLIATNAAQALLVGWAVSLFRPAKARVAIIFSLLFCLLTLMGSWNRFWPSHSDDWRGAMAAVRHVGNIRRVAVVYQVPFIESATIARPDRSPNVPEFLLAPILIYPLYGRIIPISVALDDLSRAYLETTVAPQVTRDGRFVLVTWLGPNSIDDWFQHRFSDFSHQSLGDFGRVKVTLFSRSE